MSCYRFLQNFANHVKYVHFAGL